MLITKLGIKYVLGISDQEIDPDSRLNLFVGKNGEGKTSILKAIELGLKGSSDVNIIHRGADRADILLELGDVKVHRTLKTKGANTLKVTAPVSLPGGEQKVMPIPAPQDYLDGLLSDFSFDPIHFITMDSKERSKYIRELFKTSVTPEMLSFIPDLRAGIDFSRDGLDILKELHDEYYKKRTVENKEEKRLSVLASEAAEKVKGFTVEDYGVNDVKTASDKITEIDKEISAAQAVERQAKGTQAYFEKLEKKIKDQEGKLRLIDDQLIDMIVPLKASIETIEQEIAMLSKQLADKTEMLVKAVAENQVKASLIKTIAEDNATLAALPSVKDIPDLNALEERKKGFVAELAEAERKERLYSEFLVAEAQSKEYAKQKKIAADLDIIVNKLGKELPDQITRDANIPIPGIKFDGDKIYIGNSSLDTMSTSEQVKFAVDIVEIFNSNKPLKLLCLDRAESLDDETIKEFVAQIPEGYQFFITMVQHGKDEDIPEGSFHVKGGKAIKKKGGKS